MAVFEFSDVFLLIPICITLLYFLRSMRRNRISMPTNWPLFGMLPAVLMNIGRIHDYSMEILSESGGTIEVKGPWFCNMDMLITGDPSNVHHIFSKYFSNFPKGLEFRRIFEILGDGIFNADFELWELHRRTTLSFISSVKFYSMLENAVWRKVENGLFPVLDNLLEQGIDFDLQDIFQRFTFDSICKLVLDFDPGSLSIQLPHVPCEKAFNDALEALFYRHIVPDKIWKLQKLLKIGSEKKLIQAWKSFDEFIYPNIPSNLGDDFSLLTAFKNAYEETKPNTSGDLREFLRDTSLNLMVAGRDTTSTCLTWLFWLLCVNPSAETKILKEIETKLQINPGDSWRFFGVQESRSLTYLHGALCESLRLFPPVALEHKTPIQPDTLPSGHHVRPNTKIIVSFYSMGRMEYIWGKDCLEFKPERWISDRGDTKHEPSYKFPAFNAGPRTCVGKEMAFIQMKMVAASIIYHYKIQLIEGRPVEPRDSVILQTKHGLRVKLSRRNV